MAYLPLDLITLHTSLQYIIIYDKLLQYISAKKEQKFSLKISFLALKLIQQTMLLIASIILSIAEHPKSSSRQDP